MEIQYVYQKKRSEFGRQCLFSDKGPDLIDNYPSNKRNLWEYILRDPVDSYTQYAPVQAEHEINTMRAEYTNGFMNHIEGGWPKDVNKDDEEQTKRYRRKIEKDEGFNHTILHLCKNMEHCILQNNAVNIYQQYFSDVEPTPLIEKSSARTVNVFQDQCVVKRPITHICWSPDAGTKLAISHCNLKFQANVRNETTHSYIWEVENPNRPLYVLQPPTASVCLEYNPKDVNCLVSGQFNGQIALWDTRRGTEPIDFSIIENSHRDPVHNVLWINSKTGTEFFSSSTDGQIKWWDIRKLAEPTENLILDPTKPEDQSMARAMGASCLEYETTIPTRFMVGTEHGIILSGNRKGKLPLEKIVGKFQAHLGPVLALQRNPGFVKNFLSIGDWTARIFSEDCKESPIMWTNYHKSLLTDGSWSPTRHSVFFTTRADGVLDVWDILQQQKQASISVKVCDAALRTIRAHEAGRLVAVGNQNGTTYLVEFSENLSISSKNDRALLTAMFERETRREKILEARNREIRLKQKTAAKMSVSNIEPTGSDKLPSETFLNDPQVKAAEEEFFKIIEAETKQIDPNAPQTEGEGGEADDFTIDVQSEQEIVVEPVKEVPKVEEKTEKAPAKEEKGKKDDKKGKK